MAETVIGIAAERFKDVVVHLKSILFNEDNSPKTIMGKDYDGLMAGSNRFMIDLQHQNTGVSPPLIQKIVGLDLNDVLLSELEHFMVSYGPFYRDLEFGDNWKKIKDKTWKHILRSSSNNGDENETSRIYVEAMKRIEVEARGVYSMNNDDSVTRVSSDEFVWMMILDGCFLLQVALLVLGGSKQLNYPKDHNDPFCVENWIKHTNYSSTYIGLQNQQPLMRAAIASMFLVGNQIPLLVLKELMRQSFFKNIVNQGIWEEPMELERLVLFELLLVPAAMFDHDGRGGEGGISIPTSTLPAYHRKFFFENNKSSRGVIESIMSLVVKPSKFKIIRSTKSGRHHSLRKANDLLHGLWLLMSGLENPREKEEEDKIHVDYDDIFMNETNSINMYDVSMIPSTVRSVTELKEVGVMFGTNLGARINGIRFRKHMFNASLILPQIVINKIYDKSIYQYLLRCLIRYEVLHFRQNKRKVCEYLRLMHGLIRSPEDAKFLAAKKIIIVDPKLEEEVPSIFHEIAVPEVTRNYHQSPLNSIKDELNSYTDPSMFKRLGDVLSFVVFLTLIQTVYSVLSYHLRK